MLKTESIPESESLIFWPLESESESITLGEYKAGIGIGINSTLPVTDGIRIGIDSACSEAESESIPASWNQAQVCFTHAYTMLTSVMSSL